VVSNRSVLHGEHRAPGMHTGLGPAPVSVSSPSASASGESARGAVTIGS
jgi:hypothetical protein